MNVLFVKAHPATRTMRGGDPTPAQAASGRYPKERMPWQGLTIAIEHPEGTVREGVDETGKPWRTVFRYAYGEILGTMGLDGDPVDVFIGSYPDAPEVYVVQQMRRKRWDEPDEQKCMINFASQDEAKAAYLGHYDDPRFFGGITAMPVAEFVAKVRATKENPTMIKSAPVVLFFKGHVGPYLRGGKLVNLAGYQGRQARGTPGAGQLTLFGSNKPLGPSPYAGKHPVRDTGDLFEDQPPVGGDLVAEPRADLIAEHERLVGVLRSPSHDDDKVEAKKQAGELAEYKAGERRDPRADYNAAVTSKKTGPADNNPRRKFYVTIAREGRGVHLLAGPFDEHNHAKAHVDRAREEAYKIDPKSHFDAFGTAGVESDNHKPGVLNERLGLKLS